MTSYVLTLTASASVGLLGTGQFSRAYIPISSFVLASPSGDLVRHSSQARCLGASPPVGLTLTVVADIPLAVFSAIRSLAARGSGDDSWLRNTAVGIHTEPVEGSSLDSPTGAGEATRVGRINRMRCRGRAAGGGFVAFTTACRGGTPPGHAVEESVSLGTGGGEGTRAGVGCGELISTVDRGGKAKARTEAKRPGVGRILPSAGNSGLRGQAAICAQKRRMQPWRSLQTNCDGRVHRESSASLTRTAARQVKLWSEPQKLR